jgi:alkylation response protein AidB-like acyl-CoA dehydrogenase
MAVLTEEQTMLRDMAREWADNESPVTAFRRMRDSHPAGYYDAGAWKAQAEMGWAGVLIPEEHDGVGMGFVSLALVLEQLGRTLTATPLAATAAATSAILIGGSEAQKAAWLPRIAAGELVAALAVDEGPRSPRRSRAAGWAVPRRSSRRAMARGCSSWPRRTGFTLSRRARG